MMEIGQITNKILQVAPHIKEIDAAHVEDIITRISSGRPVKKVTFFGSSTVSNGNDIDIYIARSDKRASLRQSLVGMEFTVPPETGTKVVDVTERDYSFEESLKLGEAEIREGHKTYTIFESKEI